MKRGNAKILVTVFQTRAYLTKTGHALIERRLRDLCDMYNAFWYEWDYRYC